MMVPLVDGTLGDGNFRLKGTLGECKVVVAMIYKGGCLLSK